MGLSNKFDSNIYIEPDGSSWVRVFHHNNPATYGVFYSHSNAEWNAGIYATENKWYDLGILNDITAPYELLVKQRTTSSATETAYRWTQTPNPLTTTDWNQVKPGTVTFNTNSPYSSSSMGGLYTLNGSNHMCLANNTNGNWYGIGCCVLYQGGFPGYPNTVVTTGYLDLYVRVDSLLDSTSNLGPAVWLPLNGNLQNQGLFDVGVYNSGATINNEGKIGSCYAFNGSSNFIEVPVLIDSTSYSFCCWAYFNTMAGYHLMDCRTADGSIGDQPMFVSASGIQSGNTGTSFQNCPYSFVANKWYHIAVVYSATNTRTYVNGELIGTTSCKGYNFNRILPLRIGTRCSGKNWLNGKVNDVRYYNHSLSAKEVKEISKCLVLHYKLDNLINRNLIANSALNGSWAYPSSSYADRYSPTTLVVPSGSVYTLSFDAKSTVNGDIIRTHYYSPNTTTTCISSQGTTRTASDGYMTFSLSTQWERYWVIYNQSSTTAVKHIICPRMMSGEGTGTVSVRNVKFEAGAVATPWIPSEASEILVAHDSSGFGYDGYWQSGRNMELTSDTARYSDSTRFPLTSSQTGNYITMDNASFFSALSNCTITWWGKYKAAKSLLLTGQTTSHYLAAGNPSFYNGTCTLTKWYYDGLAQGTPSYVANQWHFYAFTGTLNSWTKFMLNNYGGTDSWPINGQISDFRIYNSTLSDADILELYQTSASIDRDGNYYTRELVE